MNIQFKECNTSNFQRNRTSTIKYIVIHYTAGNSDTAKNNINYFANNANLSASAHYFVDEYDVIWQSVKDADTAWHCGTSGTYKHTECRNNNSIGIEMCSRKYANGNYYFKNETILNTVTLTKELMKKYNIPIGNVIRHYDVTGKNCPAPYVDDKAWNTFKNSLIDITPDYHISAENLNYLTNTGIINSPDYWKSVNFQYLNDLLSNINKTNIVDKRINNGIADFDTAINTLVDAGIINTPEYWIFAVKNNKVQYLKDLIINISNKCRGILEKIVHAEAQGEGLEGQEFVANVVINRSKSTAFPNGIYNVVFQNSTSNGKTTYQFTPVIDGAYAKAKPSESVKSAVTNVLNGKDASKGALFFCTKTSASKPDNWHEKNLQFLFEYKNHRFYK